MRKKLNGTENKSSWSHKHHHKQTFFGRSIPETVTAVVVDDAAERTKDDYSEHISVSWLP